MNNPSPEAVAIIDKIGAVCKDLMKLHEKHGIPLGYYLPDGELNELPVATFVELCERLEVDPYGGDQPSAWVTMGTARVRIQCQSLAQTQGPKLSTMDRLRAHLSNDFTPLH